jgi:acyl-CoA thioesterase FadM
MSDDKTKSGPQDASKINLSEDYEVRYWTEKFGVSREQLEQAVKQAGSGAAAVEAHLQRGAH